MHSASYWAYYKGQYDGSFPREAKISGGRKKQKLIWF